MSALGTADQTLGYGEPLDNLIVHDHQQVAIVDVLALTEHVVALLELQRELIAQEVEHLRHAVGFLCVGVPLKTRHVLVEADVEVIELQALGLRAGEDAHREVSLVSPQEGSHLTDLIEGEVDDADRSAVLGVVSHYQISPRKKT